MPTDAMSLEVVMAVTEETAALRPALGTSDEACGSAHHHPNR
jgi:hypothetical protein